MATAEASRAHPLHVRFANLVSNVLRRSARKFLVEIESRNTINELAQLSDHELNDIGLCRSDLMRDGLFAQRALRDAAQHQVSDVTEDPTDQAASDPQPTHQCARLVR